MKVMFTGVRAGRLAWQWSQQDLADATRCNMAFISDVEAGRVPLGKFHDVCEGLNRIAHALDAEFTELFPSNYLDALQAVFLPEQTTPVVWSQEIPLSWMPVEWEGCYSEEEALTDATHRALVDALNRALEILTNREAQVVQLRYGLGQADGEEQSYGAIGKQLGVCTKRVYQIEAKALSKLRHPDHSRALRDYL
jgi:RNA polymerase sigma factor (sigma-70 family)